MKSIFLSFFLVLIGFQAFTQNVAKSETSDPQAKILLDKVKKQYDSYKSLQADFSLLIEFPEQPKETQKGKIYQAGDKYRVETSSQTVISDGKTVWFYTRKNNECQVNDATATKSMGGVVSPKEIVRMYEKGDYIYALAGEATENGVVCKGIEFKPVSKNSEFTKLRLAIDKKTNKMVSMRTFSKDGSRYTFLVSKTDANKTVNQGLFVFDKAQFPGVHLEDLRM
jgi:outer membrane lipoprotein carrier protein